MRKFITFWLVTVGGLTTWLFLSSNDYSFGLPMFSRVAHDMVFNLYAEVLGVDPAILPPLVYRAMFVDTLIVAGLIALAKRKSILAWWRARKESARLQDHVTSVVATGPIHPAE
jgi:Family of unknown function (DUF6105)